MVTTVSGSGNVFSQKKKRKNQLELFPIAFPIFRALGNGHLCRDRHRLKPGWDVSSWVRVQVWTNSAHDQAQAGLWHGGAHVGSQHKTPNSKQLTQEEGSALADPI